jgi:hypothetical protein
MIVILMVALVTSCVSIHRHFTLYKEKPFLSKNDIIDLSGVFIGKVEKLKNHYSVMYLYHDGSMIINTYVLKTVRGEEFWNNVPQYLAKELNQLQAVPPNWNRLTGHFIIRGDSIHIEYFITQDQYWLKRNSIENFGILKNDSLIVLVSKKCEWCHKSYYQGGSEFLDGPYDPPKVYQFYYASYKPDSSKIWFKRKRWYKIGLRSRDKGSSKFFLDSRPVLHFQSNDKR